MKNYDSEFEPQDVDSPPRLKVIYIHAARSTTKTPSDQIQDANGTLREIKMEHKQKGLEKNDLKKQLSNFGAEFNKHLNNREERNFHFFKLINKIRKIFPMIYNRLCNPTTLLDETEKWFEQCEKIDDYFKKPFEYQFGLFLLSYVADFIAVKITTYDLLTSNVHHMRCYLLLEEIEMSCPRKKKILTDMELLKIILLKWLIHLPPKTRENAEIDLLESFLNTLQNYNARMFTKHWTNFDSEKAVWSYEVSCCVRLSCKDIFKQYLCCCFFSSPKPISAPTISTTPTLTSGHQSSESTIGLGSTVTI